MKRRNTPELVVATRGLVALDLDVRTGDRDLHSGHYGGTALNAIHALSQSLTALFPQDGRLPEPLRAGVVQPDADELAGWSELPPGAEELDARRRGAARREGGRGVLRAGVRRAVRRRDRHPRREAGSPEHDARVPRVGRRDDPGRARPGRGGRRRRGGAPAPRGAPGRREARRRDGRHAAGGPAARHGRARGGRGPRSAACSDASRSSYAPAGRCPSSPPSRAGGSRRSWPGSRSRTATRTRRTSGCSSRRSRSVLQPRARRIARSALSRQRGGSTRHPFWRVALILARPLEELEHVPVGVAEEHLHVAVATRHRAARRAARRCRRAGHSRLRGRPPRTRDGGSCPERRPGRDPAGRRPLSCAPRRAGGSPSRRSGTTPRRTRSSTASAPPRARAPRGRSRASGRGRRRRARRAGCASPSGLP